MATLTSDRWGKSGVRVSKVHRDGDSDDFSDVTVQVLLQGDVTPAYLAGDNSRVVPTDTMRNVVFAFAQEHLSRDLEAFGAALTSHLIEREGVEAATVRIAENRWARASDHGFIGGGSEQRVAEVHARADLVGVRAGIQGLMVLKTRGSSFVGFPTDEYTTLAEAEDRVLATSVGADWDYDPLPDDTTQAWETVRATILEHFFADWSASVQHQGWLMAEAVLETVPEIAAIDFRLPNQHHLGVDLTRFGLEDEGVVFHPVTEPYGDIRFTVTR